MKKICVGMIAKNEERDLPRCLNSLSGHVDGLVLVDTGSVDRTKEIALEWIAQEMKRDPSFFGLVETYTGASELDEKGDWKLWNFSKARNRYVDIIEKNTDFPYLLWMDADDEFKNPEKVRACTELPETIHSFAINSGGSRWPHHRLWKTKSGVKYSGWCHEYPSWSGSARHHDDINIFHDAAPTGTGEDSNARNLRILERQMESEPTSRTAFYLANTHKDGGRWEKAIPFYDKRIAYGKGYEDEYWFAVLYKARCQRFANKFNDARQTLMEALVERRDWAEFWMELAYLSTTEGKYYEAIGFALQAKDKPIVPTHLWREKDKYNDQPYRLISWAHQHLKQFPHALEWALLAREKIGGPDADWENRIESLQKLLEAKDRPQRVVEFHRPGAMGDVLMTLNLLAQYREENPNDKIIYRTHIQTSFHLKEFIEAAGADEVHVGDSPYTEAKKINLVGYPLAEGYPSKPMQKHLLEYFGAEMGVKKNALECSLSLIKPDYQPVKGKYLTLHVKAGWSMYKEWGLEKWEELCAELWKRGIVTVQIGGPDDPKLKKVFYSLLGKSFSENLAAIAHASMHVGIDSWSNHATHFSWNGKGKTPSVILWGSTQASAAGYPHNINISKGLSCQPCFKEDPKISKMPRGICQNPPDQNYQTPRHACMAEISVAEVLEKVVGLWKSL
jgi:glycosyltransferase involved in cell wall biosynthesis/ADP-heptose:LPS heptosyltransferase